MSIKIIGIAVGTLFATSLMLGSCSIVDTGNVGVKSSMGQIEKEEVHAGFTFKAPMVTSINHYNVRETALDLQNLTPKAKDNLSLKDMDVSVFYEVEPSRVAELLIEFQGQTAWDDNNSVYLPGSGLVTRMAREAVYDSVSRMESLTIHQRRELLAGQIKERLQKRLDATTPNTFKITNIVIRAITTDPSIERSIQLAVQSQKKLEQMEVQTQIAKKQAEIKVTEAEGIAKSNAIINSSLTREYLQHETNLALMEFAKKGANTVVVPANMASAPLINIK